MYQAVRKNEMLLMVIPLDGLVIVRMGEQGLFADNISINHRYLRWVEA